VILLKPGFTTHQEITAMGRYGKERPNKSLTLYGKMRMDFFHYLRKRSRSMKTVKVIRSELDVFNTSVKAFGRFDPTMNPEELKFHDVLEDIKEYPRR
jgi:hypothetical protein